MSQIGAKVLPLDCHHCIHYYVTWDENFPHGCRAMRFKSWRYPVDEVRMVFYGRDCLMYVPKKRKPRIRQKIDRLR